MPYYAKRKARKLMNEFNIRLGRNLRAERVRRGFALREVAKMTDNEFKASVLGAYERGERAITVVRLARLCRIYGIHIHKVIPREVPMYGTVVGPFYP